MSARNKIRGVVVLEAALIMFETHSRNYEQKNVRVKILACLFYLQQLQKGDEEEQKISMAHCPTHN